jgi:hypothetical protein
MSSTPSNLERTITMIQQPRLPYVRWTVEAVESKDEDGHIVYSNKYMANIVAAGGKDELVKEASEWLRELKAKGDRGQFDSAASEYGRWHDHFSAQFEKFKAGEELAVVGTPLRAVMAFMKAEVMQCERANIYSLEDLAQANEEGLRHIGIGGRALKDKATQLLASKGDNKIAEELAAAHVKIESLEKRIGTVPGSGLQGARKAGSKTKG